MDILKQILRILLTVIEKSGPTIATILAAYLAYRYAKKQKIFENKGEEHKKVRSVISNLLLIWREISTIEFYLASNDFLADLIFKSPKIAANYFNVDINRIQSFKDLFHQSKEELKTIDVSLFYMLETSFQEFNRSFNYFVNPVAKGNTDEKELKELLDRALKEVVREIEQIISTTSNYLPIEEREPIIKIINLHHNDLQDTDFNYEVPKFIIDTVNKLIPVIEPITQEEINIFISDHTVKMFMNKIAPFVFEFVLKENPISTLQGLFAALKNPNSLDEQLNENDLFMRLDLSDDENKLLLNNIALYKIICAAYRKFDRNIPMDFRRLLLNVNSGKINLKQEIDFRKAKLVVENYKNGNLKSD